MAMPQRLALLVLPLCVALDAMRMPVAKPVPITVFSGFLGAGKTTLLERCLKNSAGLTIGCVVNDVAALNVDGDVARGASPDADGVVTMSNGCACCTARDGLVEGIVALQRAAAARGGRWDHIVVEATGIAEPSSVRDALATRLPRAAGAALDSLVTVVDAAEFAGLWGSGDRVADRRELGPGREKSAKFPTLEAPSSVAFHSFRLMFGRAIISRNGLEAWMLFSERARAEHSC